MFVLFVFQLFLVPISFLDSSGFAGIIDRFIAGVEHFINQLRGLCLQIFIVAL